MVDQSRRERISGVLSQGRDAGSHARRPLSPHVMKVMSHFGEMMRADVGRSGICRASRIGGPGRSRRAGLRTCLPIGQRISLRIVLRGVAGRSGGGLQITQQRGDAVVIGAGGLGYGGKVRDHCRYAALAATLQQRNQIGDQMVSAVAGGRASRFGRSG